jgi:hypothetical protein
VKSATVDGGGVHARHPGHKSSRYPVGGWLAGPADVARKPRRIPAASSTGIAGTPDVELEGFGVWRLLSQVTTKHRVRCFPGGTHSLRTPERETVEQDALIFFPKSRGLSSTSS